MFSTLLIANRGEIACRIIRTARYMGLRTVAVYSDADRDALHVHLADEAHWIGASEPGKSYLVGEKLLEVAAKAGADCLHPGYGFLSENAEFAAACAKAGVVFIGPPPAAITAMGRKDEAKRIMEAADVPVVPGYQGDAQDEKLLAGEAEKIGYPVLIKAVAGGGGKGMRKVDAAGEFADALAAAQREAQNAFGDARVLIEKFVASPRHVEIQVFADAHGNCIHLFERDCSLQRRHQKVIEEAPAPGMSDTVRTRMGEAAVAAARAVKYEGAGTVEFIVDTSDGLDAGHFYFMEMNTRLQVEHPVTEMITGADLVEWQLRVAAGEKLPARQDEVDITGHAVEARLYAEDPDSGFLPSTGVLHLLRFPDEEFDLRVDTGVEEGGEISPFYDPMIAKVIAHGKDRADALARLAAALEATAIAGVRTNAAHLVKLLRHEDFAAGNFDTGLIDKNHDRLVGGEKPLEVLALAVLARLEFLNDRKFDPDIRITDEPVSPWDLSGGWTPSGPYEDALALMIDGKPVMARIAWGLENAIDKLSLEGRGGSVTVEDYLLDGEHLEATIDGQEHAALVAVVNARLYMCASGHTVTIEAQDQLSGDLGAGAAHDNILAPMPGRVLKLHVGEGDEVARGQKLAVLEAMKMEHALAAPLDGVVEKIPVNEGDQVDEGQVLIKLKPDDDNAA